MARLSLDVAIQEQSQNLLKIADNLDKLAKKLEGIGQIKAAPQIDVDTKKAERKMDGFATAIGTAAGFAGAKAGMALSAGLFGSLDVERTTDKLAAQLRLSADESGRVGGVAGKLYAEAYGENLGEVSSAVG